MGSKPTGPAPCYGHLTLTHLVARWRAEAGQRQEEDVRFPEKKIEEYPRKGGKEEGKAKGGGKLERPGHVFPPEERQIELEFLLSALPMSDTPLVPTLPPEPKVSQRPARERTLIWQVDVIYQWALGHRLERACPLLPPPLA